MSIASKQSVSAAALADDSRPAWVTSMAAGAALERAHGVDERRVLVTGSRDWNDEAVVCAELDRWLRASPVPLVLLHGACPTGADHIAYCWALKNGVRVRTFSPDWRKYGRSAGPRRNALMVAQHPHVALAFARGALSRGTENTLQLLRAHRPAVVLVVHRRPM